MNRLIAADWGMLITVPLVVLSLVGNTFAHMQLASPYPIRSPLNPAHKGEANIDYSYTAPLAPDGSNYPCKGYHVNAYNIASVQTYNAGEQYQFV